MAAFFGARSRPRRKEDHLRDDQVAQILADGNDSEIEEFADDEEDIVPSVLDHLEESGSSSGDESSKVDEAPPPISTTFRTRGSTRGRSGSEISAGLASARGRGRVTGRGQVRGRGQARGRGHARGRRGIVERVWVETVYTNKVHDYTPLPIISFLTEMLIILLKTVPNVL